MTRKLVVLITLLFLSGYAFAQREPMTREEKNEKNAARMGRINIKNDLARFRKEIMGLKQFEEERDKIPELRRMSKMAVKVIAAIDTDDIDAESNSKTLTGYIRQDVGDNSTNMYELTFDRDKKVIIKIKHTEEGIEADQEMKDDQAEKAEPRDHAAKHSAGKKNKDNDDDDPED